MSHRKRSADFLAATASVVLIGITIGVFGQAMDIDLMAYIGMGLVVVGGAYFAILTTALHIHQRRRSQKVGGDGQTAVEEAPRTDDVAGQPTEDNE